MLAVAVLVWAAMPGHGETYLYRHLFNLGVAALLNPMIAAAAMSFSSVSVIGNALRLRFARL